MGNKTVRVSFRWPRISRRQTKNARTKITLCRIVLNILLSDQLRPFKRAVTAIFGAARFRHFFNSCPMIMSGGMQCPDFARFRSHGFLENVGAARFGAVASGFAVLRRFLTAPGARFGGARRTQGGSHWRWRSSTGRRDLSGEPRRWPDCARRAECGTRGDAAAARASRGHARAGV